MTFFSSRHQSRRRCLVLYKNLRYFVSSSSSSNGAHRPFNPPAPILPLRVVVTGLGMVTPLGCGVETSWSRLIKGECGIRSLTPNDLKMEAFDEDIVLQTFEQLPSKVAAVVPCGTNPGEFNQEIWLRSKDQKSISRFIAFALCAADEALRDSGWSPLEQEERERTVGVLDL